MERRKLLEIAGAGVAAALLNQGEQAQAAVPSGAEALKLLAAPCGLYCGACGEYVNGKCHGCPCPCGQCAGAKYAAGCEVVKCVRGRKIESCADCPELPCTRIIQMANDPVWGTGSLNVENLRRRKRLGTDAWLAEQKQYWSDTKKRDRWIARARECMDRAQKYYK